LAPLRGAAGRVQGYRMLVEACVSPVTESATATGPGWAVVTGRLIWLVDGAELLGRYELELRARVERKGEAAVQLEHRDGQASVVSSPANSVPITPGEFRPRPSR
jgi:hypothetical protein